MLGVQVRIEQHAMKATAIAECTGKGKRRWRVRGEAGGHVLRWLAAATMGYAGSMLASECAWAGGLALASVLESNAVAHGTLLASGLLGGVVPGAVTALLWPRHRLTVAPALAAAVLAWATIATVDLLRVDLLSWVALALLVAGVVMAHTLMSRRRLRCHLAPREGTLR